MAELTTKRRTAPTATTTNLATLTDAIADVEAAVEAIPIDTVSDTVPTIGLSQYQTILGNHYQAGGVFAPLAAATSYDVAIVPPEGICDKLSWEFEGSTELSFAFYEDATYNGGAEAIARNKNRGSDNSAQTLVAIGVTGNIGTASLLSNKRVGSGKTVGGSATSGEEWLLCAGKTYLLRFTNHATPATLTGYWRISWCEKEI